MGRTWPESTLADRCCGEEAGPISSGPRGTSKAIEPLSQVPALPHCHLWKGDRLLRDHLQAQPNLGSLLLG